MYCENWNWKKTLVRSVPCGGPTTSVKREPSETLRNNELFGLGETLVMWTIWSGRETFKTSDLPFPAWMVNPCQSLWLRGEPLPGLEKPRCNRWSVPLDTRCREEDEILSKIIAVYKWGNNWKTFDIHKIQISLFLILIFCCQCCVRTSWCLLYEVIN